MQNLLADYFFQYKSIALPQVGSLRMVTMPANVVLGEQKIEPPVTNIIFSNDVVATAEVEKYVAAISHTSQDTAALQLNEFANKIVSLQPNESFVFENVGTFSKASDGTLQFTAIALPQYFVRAVIAEKVIHPDDTHTILVGDKQTDNSTMAEYYAENAEVKKDKWWLWAAVLFALSIGSIFYYFGKSTANNVMGNGTKTQAIPASGTYKVVP